MVQVIEIVCDSTGNTSLAQKLLVEWVPTLIALVDVCHHISNLIKDIVRLAYFSLPIKVVHGTIKYFHTSHIGIANLAKAREQLAVGHSLESIGKIQFSTVVHSSVSVQRCIPAIQKAILFGRVKFDDFQEYYRSEPTSHRAFNFRFGLEQLIKIGSPPANTLTCLEAVEVMAADAYFFWHAMVGKMVEVLFDPRNEFPEEVQEDILGIIEHCHDQLFSADGNLSSMAYLAATYLNPNNLHSDIFKNEKSNLVKRLCVRRLEMQQCQRH
ncbi:hypothetical protein ARMGADRAFT_1096473 [Armillaria gallica]|uniref:DUF659 domain-containing protein n=1 Tax=Armillaria gallica TaxID=47427 RepID=A0A2H3EM64_ARMGA|nr:hypothetical protein ARMGADRAFT_1096473 [Armillaria gallica]